MNLEVLPEQSSNHEKKRKSRVQKGQTRRSGLTDKGLTLQGEFAPLIKTCELADWLNFASGNQAQWTSDRVRDYLQKVGALQRLPEDPDYDGSLRRPKPKTKRRTFYTTLSLLSQKIPEFYDALLRRADPDVLDKLVV